MILDDYEVRMPFNISVFTFDLLASWSPEATRIGLGICACSLAGGGFKVLSQVFFFLEEMKILLKL